MPDRRLRDHLLARGLTYDRSLTILGDNRYTGWTNDKSRFDRQELVSRSRHFELSSPLANRLARLFCDYTAGPRGIVASPASADEEWNQIIAQVWADAQRRLVLGPLGLNGFGAAQAGIVWRWFFDGEVFLLLTRRPETNEPAVQVIEAQRVSSPTPMPKELADRQVDGVEFDPDTGDIVAYHILTARGRTTRVPAEMVIHVMDPGRADQYRGIPILTPALDDLHRLQDLEHYEMLAHVDSAEKSMIFKLRTGEFEGDDARLAALGLIEPDTPAPEARERLTNYAKALGGRAIAILPDEEATVVTPQRPTDEQRAFWDYLINKVCIAVGVPRQLVAPFSVQGTVARADLGAARNTLISMADILLECVRRVYEYTVTNIVSSSPRLQRRAPSDYLAVSLRPPKQIDVDLGRSTAAMIEELKYGATHWETIYGANGLDWREEMRKRADQLAYMMMLARERGLDPAWLTAMLQQKPLDGPALRRDREETSNEGNQD